MSLWLLDASVLLAGEDPDDEHHADAMRLLRGDDPLATLDLAFYEVTNVAIRAWRDPAAADRLRERVVAVAETAASSEPTWRCSRLRRPSPRSTGSPSTTPPTWPRQIAPEDSSSVAMSVTWSAEGSPAFPVRHGEARPLHHDS